MGTADLNTQPEQNPARNRIRFVTAASLFDGHDVTINIIRRVLVYAGCEVIHLGHNRSAEEIVSCAVDEDAQAIAVTSYQGGHLEFFRYLFDLLKERGAGHIRIFGGGGGVILPHEVRSLMDYGICRIYSPDDGRAMGIDGMVADMIERSDFPPGTRIEAAGAEEAFGKGRMAALISAAENDPDGNRALLDTIGKRAAAARVPVIGITGPGGAGKSSLVDELLLRFLLAFRKKRFAVISVDPTKKKSGGGLLGDRIRMNRAVDDRVYMRSMATRRRGDNLPPALPDVLNIVKAEGFDAVILETSGIGQSDTGIVESADLTVYVMTPEYGSGIQLEKINMLDYADMVVINKFDRNNALDALAEVKKLCRLIRDPLQRGEGALPVHGTTASRFNDPGVNAFFKDLLEKLSWKEEHPSALGRKGEEELPEGVYIIPPARTRYLAEIAERLDSHGEKVEAQAVVAGKLFGIKNAIDAAKESDLAKKQELLDSLGELYRGLERTLDRETREIIRGWPEKARRYREKTFTYTVRGKEITVESFGETLSGLGIPKISLPGFRDWGDLVRWCYKENVPGEFPYTAGVFPFKREAEDPARMFAGEGGPERTNVRFHYLARGLTSVRLSTAFDSVTLYGEDPSKRPDIYGKVGNSGVSVCCLDDAKKLYSGFDLSASSTSVSMTINGPAPVMAGFFLNAAVDQQCEIHIRKNGLTGSVTEKIKSIRKEGGPAYNGPLPEGHDGLGLMLLGVTGDMVLSPEVYHRIKADTLKRVRGTVQADILKEDQAQNTCIFSMDFSLKLMGDIQAWFIENSVRNFYSVSISGYHIAEAGANPITQLAFTLANGFTYVEYYLSRGMEIDSFAPNLSFFFSNGMEPEYAVIGRVARRIWARAMRYYYGAKERSRMLKYHIQTSGRSLHAQDIDLNDIRTTLQALYAIYDNCNSLHTNAYDEAITTPTEASVRRALAIQLIINRELGLTKNQNPLQGAFIIEELTDLVEEAVLKEFHRIADRGGVLGAMERMYQRGRIQEESMHYETLKQSGKYPIVGVNTFLSKEGSPIALPSEVIRATEEEKEQQIETAGRLHAENAGKAEELLKELGDTVIRDENVFASLMETVKYCSLGQITATLYRVGGRYRRNM